MTEHLRDELAAIVAGLPLRPRSQAEKERHYLQAKRRIELTARSHEEYEAAIKAVCDRLDY